MNEKSGADDNLSRRKALVLALTAAGSLATGFFLRGSAAKAAPLRLPGALLERDFLAACIRCFQCANVCPNQCIAFEGLGAGPLRAFAPVIYPREQACILCMKCTEACPTDALAPIPAEAEAILKSVDMGLAVVSEDLCYSFNGRICGVCYYACPFPDKAIKLQHSAQPVVDKEACVGCGSCERACIHLPQAIRIKPRQS
jgi:ferredoxin-type protein NapG